MSEYQLMTEDQRDMVKLVKDFLMKEYLPHVSEYEAKGEYPLEFHKKLGELGLFAMDVPEEYGGLGLDAVTTCLIREAIGYVDAGFASSFAASTFGIKPVLLAGTEEQKKDRWHGRETLPDTLVFHLLESNCSYHWLQ